MGLIVEVNDSEEMCSLMCDNKVPGIEKKCSDCKWLDLNDKHTIGYKCTNPNKKFRGKNVSGIVTAMYKYKSCKACKMFEEA